MQEFTFTLTGGDGKKLHGFCRPALQLICLSLCPRARASGMQSTCEPCSNHTEDTSSAMGLGYISLFKESIVILQELLTFQADTVRQPAAPSGSVHHHTALVGHRLFQGKPLMHASRLLLATSDGCDTASQPIIGMLSMNLWKMEMFLPCRCFRLPRHC